MEREIAELKKKTQKNDVNLLKQQGKMAIQMGGDVHYVDAPANMDEEFVQIRAEPKINTSASVLSGYQFTDESTEKSAREVEEAKKQAEINRL